MQKKEKKKKKSACFVGTQIEVTNARKCKIKNEIKKQLE